VGWSTPVTLTIPSNNANLSIIGAGNLSTVGGGDATVIVDNYNSNNSLLTIIGNSNASSIFRLAGITVETGSGPVKYSGLVAIGGFEQFRFDHSHLSTTGVSGTAGMRITGCVYGVADHNIIDGTGVNNGIQEYNQGSCYSDAVGVGDQAWAHATAFGTSQAFYLENNTFNNGFGNDCTMGGSFVVRFNTFNEPSNPNAIVQTHPTGGAGRFRGCRQSETYKNTFNVTSFMNSAVFYSSGTGMIWGNTCPSSSASGGLGCKILVQLESIRVSNATYPQTATPNGWGYCGTAFNGTGSNWDGNSPASTGYACLDQPGRGLGDLLTGGFSADGSGSNNVTNNATGCTAASACAYPRQALEPVYIWSLVNQEWQPVPNNSSCFACVGVGTSLLAQNTDFYTSTGNDGNLISFTGTSGIGVGTRATRPASTTNGVAYWATTDSGSGVTWNNGAPNSGCLDKVVSGSWVNCFYTPYAYPHPLISGGAAAVPTYTPGTGTYTAPQTVTISSTTSGATICYTTDGSTPTANGAGTCTHGTTYIGTITVSTTQTVQAVASKSGTVDSSVGTAAFTINQAPAPVMFLGPIQMIGKVTIP